VPHLARLSGVDYVLLIDRERYEPKNLHSQDILRHDVGQWKARVQARRMRRINTALHVAAVTDEVSNVPLGRLRADVLLTCVDSRQTRQYVNQAVWRLGVPWIDAGVEASGLLARVNLYLPAADAPCLECSWDQRDYELLEQTYPCQGNVRLPAATNAPSSLGALAASLQALACQQLLTGREGGWASGCQVSLDAMHQQHYVTTCRRHPGCRFDHDVWQIAPLPVPERLTIGHVLQYGESGVTASNGAAFGVEGKDFLSHLTCLDCGRGRPGLYLAGRLPRSKQTCTFCQGPMMVAGFNRHAWLDIHTLPLWQQRRSLRSLGLLPGDVISIRGAMGVAHFELGDRSNG
jgi:hypothetical protein